MAGDGDGAGDGSINLRVPEKYAHLAQLLVLGYKAVDIARLHGVSRARVRQMIKELRETMVTL